MPSGATDLRRAPERGWEIPLRGERARHLTAGRTWSTFAAVAFAGALALLLAYGEVRVLQADGYKALYAGRWIVAHGVPHTNPLSAVDHGGRWVDAQWLAEVIYYAIWRVGGLALVAIVSAVSIAAAYMMLALLLRRRGVSVGWTILLTACALLGLRHWGFVRAQDLVLPLFTLLLFLCITDSEQVRPGKRLLLLIPLLVLWANMHGSVMLGAALAVGYLLWRGVLMARAGARRDAVFAFGLAAVVAVTPLCTPYGPQVIDYYQQFAGNHAQHVAGAEGRSPAFPGGTFFAVYGGLALLLIVAARALIGRHRAPWLLLGAGLLTAIAASGRIGNLPWFAIVLALVAGELVRAVTHARRGGGTSIGAAVIIALAAGLSVAVILNLAMRSQSRYESDTPMQITAAAARTAAGHPCWTILADNLDASALEWHHPELAGRIAYDARVELYSEPAMMRWAIFQSGRLPGWLESTNGYQLLVAANRFRPRLAARLATMPGRTVIARDDRGIAVLNTGAAAACP